MSVYTRDFFITLKDKYPGNLSLEYINEFIAPINVELKNFKIESDVYGRAKHYYSIFRKMETQGKKIADLYE